MRTLFCLILISTNCFGQHFGTQPDLRFPGKIDSIILGDWYLKETIISPAFSYDSIPIIRQVSSQNRTITITSDSIISQLNSKYYSKNEKFEYEISDADLNLFQGRKKKRRKVRSLNIVKHSPRELVIANLEIISGPFDSNVLTVYHVYHRVEKSLEYDTILAMLQNKWTLCSNKYIPFLTPDTSIMFNFSLRSNGIDICSDSSNLIELTFSRDEFDFQNTLLESWQSGIFGTLSVLPFYFDFQLENIIIPGTQHLAYRIVVDSNLITLELNQKLTAKLNTENP